ncbi:MAG: ABC transporter substrate-binding protein [Betaproteobacteria bacterium RIFCSPLOWO2_12_FULL_63_13]|nr:MAG: ABC transporter substrate-binding protein [Betaproteobacteria bacterium RIFCSPLOWO2_02_FULL_63_19]OGA46196.1 MAG: ABC transporter substrate-binding protein [Betaproteobacteria bacterium RIFCSPLOWO2_12_FULL_63_13]
MKNRSSILVGALLASTGITLAIAPAYAQAQADSSKIAQMQGADRQQRLVEGARKEGELTLYTSAPVDDVAVLTRAFEKKYGVKVKVWRAGSEKVMQRTVTEARAGRFDVDIVDTNGPEMEALHREKLLVAVKSPHLGDLIPQAIQPHGEWVGSRINIFAAAYNTKAVTKEDLPKTYDDLLDPKWKGKLGIEAEDFDWFAGVLGEIGEAKGVKLFHDIVAKNGISVRKGHTLLTNLVASGEVPLALTIYNYKAEQLKRKGAPIDWFIFAPAIARPNGAGMLRRAPHPHAAVLYFDFTFSDAQAILLKRNFVPTSRKVKTVLNQMPLKFIDPAVILDQEAKWNRLYQDTIIKQAR